MNFITTYNLQLGHVKTRVHQKLVEQVERGSTAD